MNLALKLITLDVKMTAGRIHIPALLRVMNREVSDEIRSFSGRVIYKLIVILSESSDLKHRSETTITLKTKT